MLLIIILYFFHNYFWPRPWPQSPEIGLGPEVLASFNITDIILYWCVADVSTASGSGKCSQ